MKRLSSSSSDSIPMTEMAASGPRESNSLDEELDTLLVYNEHPQQQPPPKRRRLRALAQMAGFTLLGLLIVVASGFLAYYTFHDDSPVDKVDFVHVPLPGMKNPGLLKYLGGLGPYIGGEYTPVPETCSVTQLHMISRHGERYPTHGMGVNIAAFAANIARAPELNWNSDLGFLNGWTLATDGFMPFPEQQWDQETLTGPAAGSRTMFTLGNEFRTRYAGLWEWGNADERIRVWASNMTRVIDSAEYFAQGFFGINADVEYEIIPETADQWGNSLTTSGTCAAFMNGEYNSSYGFESAADTFLKTFLYRVGVRLNHRSRHLTIPDVIIMSYLCGFQLNALGHSPFCDIFSDLEWEDLNYARDLATYYGSGPGNPYGITMGIPWVEAVINLMLNSSTTNNNIYLSFSHDTDIVPIIPALGLFQSDDPDPMPWDKMPENYIFYTTSIVPMGGHIVIERLRCGAGHPRVRVLVNERVQPVPGCAPSKEFPDTCDLAEFERVVRGRWGGKGFCETCAPNNVECIDKISFYN